MRLTNGFSWSTTFNYLKNKSRVDSLTPGLRRSSSRRSGARTSRRARVSRTACCSAMATLRDSATGKMLLSGGLPTRDPDQADSRQRESELDRRLGERVPLQERRAQHARRLPPRRPELLGRQLVGSVRRHSRVDARRAAKSIGTSRASCIDGIDTTTKQAEHDSSHGRGLQPHRLSDQRSRHLQHGLHQAA